VLMTEGASPVPKNAPDCAGADAADVPRRAAGAGVAAVQAVTDEASAVEALGLQPKLVLSESSNFKVTYPQDLLLAELLLNKNR